ncbi:MAG: peptidoglycan DD-metalloendopeptidase family protein [Bacillota bacterium]|nr:peptidoglycan DD-metalloendopeptidase family protein [Bacillota bacterium]
MNKDYTNRKADPVPSRVKILLALGCTLLMAVSIIAGTVFASGEKEIPVVLADGSVITPPWYITIDGEKVALVESRETAEKTLDQVIRTYQGEDSLVLDVEVKEAVEAEKMELKHGDEPPEILTTAEAKKKITKGNGGDGYLTVITTEEAVEEQPVEFEEEFKTTAELYVGEMKVEEEGEEGTKEVTKRVIRENGQSVAEEVVDEEILEEAENKVILTGIKEYDGYGGGEEAYGEEGISYDPAASYGKLRVPVDTVRITSGFGQRWGRLHRGIDLALAQGSSIYAADGGVVYFSGWGGTYGNIVKIDHGNGMQTYYAHCSKLLVTQGQTVGRGQRIALVGSTGNSTGPHLHFEVIVNKTCRDPVNFLDF